MVSRVQGRRTSHRIRDHCWVTRAAECSSQQDLGTADSQHPAILPCSTLHLFSLEIIHTAFMAFKIHDYPELAPNFLGFLPACYSWSGVCDNPASTLPVGAARTQGREGIPALAVHTCTLPAQYTQHNASHTSIQHPSRCQQNYVPSSFTFCPFLPGSFMDKCEH